MDFIFIDGVQADKVSKKLMRRHVMKGKNAGRTLQRPSRQLHREARRPKFIESSLSAHNNTRSEKGTRLPGPEVMDLELTCGNIANSNICYPMVGVVLPDSHKVIHEFFLMTVDRMYPARLGVSLQDYKSTSLQSLFADEFAFDCHISLMRACNEIFLSDGDSPPKALLHLARTLTLVKSRLEGDNALSDSTISILLTLIFQELIRREDDAALIHAKGLERIVALRGGLSRLESNNSLVLKMCKTDIILALQHGGPTLFFRDTMPQVRRHLDARGQWPKSTSLELLSQRHELDRDLRQTLSYALSFCSLFNDGLLKSSFNFDIFQEMIMSICYRLLRFRTLNESRELPDLQSAFHVGLALFMMSAFIQCTRRRIVVYKLMPLCIKGILGSSLYEHNYGFDLWLIVLGGIWSSGELDSEWLALEMRSATKRLGLTTWTEVRRTITKFPWIHNVHDQLGSEFWNNAQQKSTWEDNSII